MGKRGKDPIVWSVMLDQQSFLLLFSALSSQVQSHAPGYGLGDAGEVWKRASEQVWKRGGSEDVSGSSDVLKPPFDRVVLELNRLEGVDTMKRGLASLIRPRFGKRNFSSFRMSNRMAAMPETRHGGTAFANFIFDLAKHMQRPEATFGEDRDAELANLIGLRERLGNEVAMREMLEKRSAPSAEDKVVFEQQPNLVLF